MGVPSIAVSMGAYAPPYDFPAAAAFCGRNLDLFVEFWDEDHYLNINVPNGARAGDRPVITFPSRRIYGHELAMYDAPNRDIFCFLGGPAPGSHLEEGSDCSVLARGHISVSPIAVHPANSRAAEERYRKAAFR
jgi:5'-nucleotidase